MKRLRYTLSFNIIFVLLLMGIFACSTAIDVLAAQDTTAPIINNVTINETEVSKPGTISLTFDLVESGTGLSRIDVSFMTTDKTINDNPYIIDTISCTTDTLDINPTIKTGQFSLTFNIGEKYPANDIQVGKIDAYDSAGNHRLYWNGWEYGEDSNGKYLHDFDNNNTKCYVINDTVNVNDLTGNTDHDPPILKSVTFNQKRITKPGTISLTFDILEEGTGVSRMDVDFMTSGEYDPDIHYQILNTVECSSDLFEINPTLTTGKTTLTFNISSDYPTNDIQLGKVALFDDAGNYRLYWNGYEYGEDDKGTYLHDFHDNSIRCYINHDTVTMYQADSVVASGTCGENLTWVFDSDGVLSISGTGDMDNYEYYYQYSTTAPWGPYRDRITSISLDEGITSIGNYAFRDFQYIQNDIDLPETLQSIGGSAFQGCVNLSGDLAIPESVTFIGSNAFCDCENLTGELSIPEGITAIKANTFMNCKKLSGELLIPPSVTVIGKQAFMNCGGIKSLTLDAGTVMTVDSGSVEPAFYGCTGIENLIITGSGELSYESEGGNVPWTYAKDSLKTLSISNDITSIGNNMFKDCQYIESELDLPDNLVSIGADAFMGCSRLTGSIDIPDTVTTIGSRAFSGCMNLTGTLVIPEGVTSVKGNTFSGCEKIEGVVFHSGVTAIGVQAFMGCSGIKSMTIDASTAINLGSSVYRPAFYGCNSIEELTITGSGVLGYGDEEGYSPWNDSKSTLKTITISDGITEIGPYLFAYCSNTTDPIILPSQLITVGSHAFDSCYTTPIPKNVESIGAYAFEYWTCSDGVLKVPEGVSALSNGTFMGCSSLESIVIPENTLCEANSIFKNCDNASFYVFEDSSAENYVKANNPNNYIHWIASGEYDNFLPHAWNEDYTITVEPSCTEVGSKRIDCSKCKAYKDTTVVDALGHDLTHFDGKAATCTEDGWKAYDECSRGDYTTYEKLDKLGHDLTHHDAKAATCTEDGWKAYDECSRGDYTTYEKVDKLGHDLIHHDAKAATCTEEGWNAYDECSRGDYTTYTKVDKLAHETIHHAAKAATCTEDGWKAYDTCKNCDYTTYVKIDKLGHDWGAWQILSNPTCNSSGMRARFCNRCNEEDRLEIAKLSHNWNSTFTVDVKPTCTKEGSKSKHCTNCDGKTEVTVIPATGHKWNSDYTVDKKATYAKAGSKSIHCSVCDAVKSGSAVSIPKLTVKATTISKVIPAKNGFTVKWKKGKSVNGYQIQYALNKKFTSGKKTLTIKKVSTLSKKFTKLKAKKKYYVRIRTFKIVNGKKYYSKWSKPSTVVTKK